MKRKILSLTLCTLLALSLVACKKEEEPVIEEPAVEESVANEEIETTIAGEVVDAPSQQEIDETLNGILNDIDALEEELNVNSEPMERAVSNEGTPISEEAFDSLQESYDALVDAYNYTVDLYESDEVPQDDEIEELLNLVHDIIVGIGSLEQGDITENDIELITASIDGAGDILVVIADYITE